MGRISCNIASHKERAFRDLVSAKIGKRKGSISIALEQAIDEWMKKHDRRSSK